MTIKSITYLNNFNLLQDSIQMMEEPVEQFVKGQLSDERGKILLEDLEGLSSSLEKVNEKLDYYKTVEYVYYGTEKRHRKFTTKYMDHTIKYLCSRVQMAISSREDEKKQKQYDQSQEEKQKECNQILLKKLNKINAFTDPFTSKYIAPISDKVHELFHNFSEKIKNQIYSLIPPNVLLE